MATVLTNQGRAILTGLASGLTSLLPKYLGIGTGAGTAAAADTTLFTEETTASWAGYARPAGTLSQQTGSVANDTWQCVASLTNPSAGTTQGITNAMFFDAATAGNGFIKGDFAVVNLAPGDSAQVTGTLKFL